jgi:catechol 2,3-dioxygenase-like lactoylglutathione lyase family enzyme
MDVPVLPASGARPYNPTNLQLFDMFNIAGARERHQSARLPGSRVAVEIMEIQDVPHQTIPLRLQDPGAATLVFIVGNVDAMAARLATAGVSIVTPGGKPIASPDGSRRLLIRDLDNRFVELRQLAPGNPAPSSSSPSSDIADMRLSMTVNDMPQTLRVYRDVLGFAVEDETPFAADASMRQLTGLANVQVRRSRVQAPGSQLWIELVEFKGVERRPLRMRIQDRGAARLQLRVQNVDAMVAAMKAAGMRVDSVGGTAVPIPPNLKGALVADPNNFFFTPYAPCDGCAPTLRSTR